MIFTRFQLPLLLLVSRLFLYSTRVAFILYCLYIWQSSRFLAWWHFYLLKLQCILTDIFLLFYRELWCRPANYWGWCSQFSLVDSIILPSWRLSTKFGTCTYQCFFFLYNFTPIHKHVVGLNSSWAFSLSCPFMIALLPIYYYPC